MGLSSFASKVGNWLYNATGSAASAQQNYEYQKEAMQNRHQWEVADLRKAGLNPILSANSGAATGGMGGTGSPAADINLNPLSYVNSAVDAMNKLATNDAIEAGIDKTKAETETTKAQGRYLTSQEKNVIADTALKNVSSALSGMELAYWKNNQDKYGVKMSGKAFPNYGIGAGAEVVSQILRPFFSGNSAKDLHGFKYSDSP